MLQWLIALLIALCGNGTQSPQPTVVVTYRSGLVFEYMSQRGIPSNRLEFVLTDEKTASLKVDGVELVIKEGDVACLPLSEIPIQFHGLAEKSNLVNYPGYGCLRIDDANQGPK